GSSRVVSIPSSASALSRYFASGSSLPGGFVVSNRMIACSLETVSASTAVQSGFKQRLDLSDHRLKGEIVSARSRCDLVSILALPLREQLTSNPRSGARIPKPVDIQARGH